MTSTSPSAQDAGPSTLPAEPTATEPATPDSDETPIPAQSAQESDTPDDPAEYTGPGEDPATMQDDEPIIDPNAVAVDDETLPGGCSNDELPDEHPRGLHHGRARRRLRGHHHLRAHRPKPRQRLTRSAQDGSVPPRPCGRGTVPCPLPHVRLDHDAGGPGTATPRATHREGRTAHVSAPMLV